MNSIDELKELYKPYKVIQKDNIFIFNSTSGDYVIKEKKNDILSLYNYLKSRNFNYFPKLIKGDRNDLNVFEYVTGIEMPIEQKASDMIEIISLLHDKTSFYKEVSNSTYKDIYTNLIANINDLRNYYNDLFDVFILDNYLSPSKYLFIRNYYEINSCLNFCEKKSNDWYELVKDKREQRVSVVHNNLKFNHFIKGDSECLTSWDNSIVDTPIVDLIKLYKNEFHTLSFDNLIKKYFDITRLNDDEKELFFICISIPNKIELTNNEYENCKVVSDLFDYIYKTERLLEPYYSVKKEE